MLDRLTRIKGPIPLPRNWAFVFCSQDLPLCGRHVPVSFFDCAVEGVFLSGRSRWVVRGGRENSGRGHEILR